MKDKKCPSCGHEFECGLDICTKCEEDFGYCDEKCGNDHCQHCGHNTYSVRCPSCREQLPLELWE